MTVVLEAETGCSGGRAERDHDFIGVWLKFGVKHEYSGPIPAAKSAAVPSEMIQENLEINAEVKAR